ncbi:nuA3 HAT complex component nto1, partial [Rhizopus stolonifer]
IKKAPKPMTEDILLPEDSACAVCDDTEVENSNAIVFCDGCNVAVHQECYGIPYIPEGQWLCRKCMISPENPVSCLFCPNEGGAFKQTNTNQWGHLLCAIWIPEVGVGNPIYMEPIEMIEHVPKSRWKLTCSICRKKRGACIQCDNKHCFSAFHVTCAKAAGLCMKMNTLESDGVVLKAYCEKHTPKEYLQDVQWAQKKKKVRQTTDTKVARAHQHQYSTGAPIAPDVILQKIDHLSCVCLSGVRKKPQLVNAVAHYWSLKRESRRGAPLLKRLHLEPWTAVSKYDQDEDEQAIRQQVITQLRADLEKIRMLSEQVQKRERLKLERTRKQKAYLEMILFPLEHVLEPILHQLMEIDRKKLFFHPVTDEEAPDYHTVIKKPMCFSIVQHRLTTHGYTCLNAFIEDVSLIWNNAIQYNPPGNGYYRVANKLKTAAHKLLPIAQAKMSQFQLGEDGMWQQSIDTAIFDYKGFEEGDPWMDMDLDLVQQETTVKTEQEEDIMDELNVKSNENIPQYTSDELPLTSLELKDTSPEAKDSKENALSTPMEITPDKQEDKRTKRTKKRKFSEPKPRLTRSAGLEASIEELTKRTKISHEARALFASYNGVSHLNRPVESYKENRKKYAPVGWVYVDDEDEDGDNNNEEEDDNSDHHDEENNNANQENTKKYTKPKRNDMSVPDFNRGEIVWARVTGYPSHPAKFLNYSDEEAGPKLVASRRFHGDILVEFLKVPEIHKYGWVARNTICEMGDPEIDRIKLSEALKQKTKRQAFIQEAKEGYRCAGSILGLDPEPLLKSVFDTPIPKKKKASKKVK